MKRPRLRFTLRTLAIVVTLVCCYAACWGPTKTQGVRDVAAISYGFGPNPTDVQKQSVEGLLKMDDIPARAPLLISVDVPKSSINEVWFGKGSVHPEY